MNIMGSELTGCGPSGLMGGKANGSGTDGFGRMTDGIARERDISMIAGAVVVGIGATGEGGGVAVEAREIWVASWALVVVVRGSADAGGLISWAEAGAVLAEGTRDEDELDNELLVDDDDDELEEDDELGREGMMKFDWPGRRFLGWWARGPRSRNAEGGRWGA
jgi:hypothetical protein